VVELVADELVVAWLGVCSGRGREGGREREREKVAETGKRLIFWLTLDPICSSLRP
jgi:hypothetical protein